MWRVYVSRCFNRFIGGHDEMLSTRLHREQHWSRHVVNVLFLDLHHCRRSFLWEKRYAQTYQKTTRSSQKKAGTLKEVTGSVETQTQGGDL